MQTKSISELPLFSTPPPSPSPGRAAAPAASIKSLSVTELTTQIRRVLEPSFAQVWVQGEVSNYKPAGSGHVYFSLKDEGASISAAAFGWGARKKNFALKDGLKVLCRGKISVYPPRGNYQLVVDLIEPLGAGALQAEFENLKAKLTAEGLFDRARKRALPRYPSRIAVITSPTGAVIQDMLNVLKRRAPHLKIVVVPALVQGDEASSQVMRGLEFANRHRLGDVIVLARGGGSMEDLWGFNDEALARAIAKSEIPVISAVGHEVDFTIADFVADLRAPTPSAAAEIVSGYWVEAVHRLRESSSRLVTATTRDLMSRKTLLSHIAARVVSPRDRLRDQAQRLDELGQRLTQAIRRRMDRKEALLEQSMGKLDALSPLRVLKRGYALVRDRGIEKSQKTIIKSVHQVNSGQELEITFYDGQRSVRAL